MHHLSFDVVVGFHVEVQKEGGVAAWIPSWPISGWIIPSWWMTWHNIFQCCLFVSILNSWTPDTIVYDYRKGQVFRFRIGTRRELWKLLCHLKPPSLDWWTKVKVQLMKGLSHFRALKFKYSKFGEENILIYSKILILEWESGCWGRSIIDSRPDRSATLNQYIELVNWTCKSIQYIFTYFEPGHWAWMLRAHVSITFLAHQTWSLNLDFEPAYWTRVLIQMKPYYMTFCLW